MPIPQADFVLKGLDMCQRRFQYSLEKTPDERVDWSPGDAEKSPLQVAANLAHFLRFIAHTLAHQEMPNLDAGFPPAPTTRDAAKEAVEAGCAEVRRLVVGLEPGDLARRPPAPWIESTLEEVLWLINGTMLYHLGQLNYIQLCYGDRDPNIPPDWGKE